MGGRTALHLAAANGDHEMVSCLLAAAVGKDRATKRLGVFSFFF